MNVVPLRHAAFERRALPAAPVHVARVEIFDSMAAAEPYWRALELAQALATPYQRYDFLRLWQRHVGAQAGVTPFIVIGFDAAAKPMFLWPFGRRSFGGLRVVEFLGGKHSNFNVALWRSDVAANIRPADIETVLKQLAPHADALLLANQSLTWSGTTNPFALLPYQRSANSGFSGALVRDFEALLRARANATARKKMRKKERKLFSYGIVHFLRAGNVAEARQMLDAFFKQKAARMRVLGVPNVFASAAVRYFIEAAATERLPDGNPIIEVYALKVNDITVATMGGMAGDDRFCAMFNSIAEGPVTAESPGEQLMLHLVRACCERGLGTIDLGIGEANYKSLFCPDVEPLFDSFFALSAAGKLLVFAARIAATIKRAVKQHPAIWNVVRGLRRWRARFSPAP
jgi:CelD/BcsL family acetyltransferase involved in cellulose biosynthesis